MLRIWPILATLIAAIAVSMGSSGLRALHVATSPEHSAHRAANAQSEPAAPACGHGHGGLCSAGRVDEQGASERGIARTAGVDSDPDGTSSQDPRRHSHDSRDAGCATCDLLTTLASEAAPLSPHEAPGGAVGDADDVLVTCPTVRTLASVRARPPPAA